MLKRMLKSVNPITLLLATLCMTWVGMGSVGSFSVKLPYLALALVIVYACSGPRKLRDSLLVWRRYAFWIVPCLMYILVITVIQSGSEAASSGPRQLFYLIGFTALAGTLAASPSLSRTLRFGAALGLVTFVVAVEVLARSVGLSWERAITEFASGNLNFVVYSFFREVFNSIDPNDPMGASTKNEVADGVLILALLFRSATKNPARDISGISFMVGCMGLLLLLNTRSVLIAAGISIVLPMIIAAMARPGQSLPPLLLKGGAALALVVLAVGSSMQSDAMSGTLNDRFSFDDPSTADRLEQYQAALAAIEAHPFAGNGYFQVGGHPIHNLFLFSWADAGLGAFLLVIAFYVGILGSWMMFMRRIVKRPDSWVLPIAAEWIAPLPITPLFRVWQNGDGGNMFLGEWIATGCFFGCLLANELRSRAVARQMRQQPESISPMPRTRLAHVTVQ